MTKRGLLYWFLESPVLGLIGGAKDSEGNVFIDGKPVCDKNWDLNDAEVVCKQFGFRKALNFTKGKNTKFHCFDQSFAIIFWNNQLIQNKLLSIIYQFLRSES